VTTKKNSPVVVPNLRSHLLNEAVEELNQILSLYEIKFFLLPILFLAMPKNWEILLSPSL
jgi:hypothetical protein